MYGLQSTTILQLLAAERGAQLRRSAASTGCRRRGRSGLERVGLALIRLEKRLAPPAARTVGAAP